MIVGSKYLSSSTLKRASFGKYKQKAVVLWMPLIKSRGVKHMRRKLIKQEAFDRIISESVTTAERELVEVESILAKAVGKDHLRLKSFTESTVVYESVNGDFVHAGYEIKNGQITFNNIEELVIDEESTKEKRKQTLSEMIDAVLLDNSSKAEGLFGNYLGMVRWNEAKKELPEFLKKLNKKRKEEKDHDKDHDEDHEDHDEDHDEDDKLPAFLKNKKKKSKKHDEEKKKKLVKKAKKVSDEVAEAYVTSQNVLDYVEYMKVGPTLAEAVTKTDDRGNITDIRIPSKSTRNENRLLRSEWKGLNCKVAETRKTLADLVEDQSFCKAVASLKRQNAFSDAQGLEEALDNVVQTWPNVIFATQSELSEIISEALSVAGATNYDDETCDFMAEGVLRKAHDVYTEKVAQVMHLASAPKAEEETDAYVHFQNVVENFYPALDEKFGLERKVFVDLYESLGVIYKKADRRGDKALKNETASYLNDLAAVLNNEAVADLELAEDSAEFLANIIETNLESGVWIVSNKPHETVSGDHPDMSKKATHSYSPSKDFSGDYGDPAPAVGSDDMKYKGGKHSKQMRDHGWGQEGGKDVFPSLNNPYVPKPFGDYTMKGEKGVDKDGQHHTGESKDTYPNLKNPYVGKEAGGVGGKGHKMNHGKEADLVVDR